MLLVAIPKIVESHWKQQLHFITIQSFHTGFVQHNLRKKSDLCDCLPLLKAK